MTPATVRMSGAERRLAVLRVAISAFSRGGYEGTSTEDIARRAGISQPYLFRLFGTKRGLFVATVERCFARVHETFEHAAEGKAGQDALEAMGESYSGLLADRELLLLQMHAYAASDDPQIRTATRAGYRGLWELVVRLSGAPAEQVRGFFATGMLLNVVAALDLTDLDEAWAKECAVPAHSTRHLRRESAS